MINTSFIDKLKKFYDLNLLSDDEFKFLLACLQNKYETFEHYYVWAGDVYNWEQLKLELFNWLESNDQTKAFLIEITSEGIFNIKVEKSMDNIDIEFEEESWDSCDEYRVIFPNGTNEQYFSISDAKEAIEEYLSNGSDYSVEEIEVEVMRRMGIDISVHGEVDLKKTVLNKYSPPSELEGYITLL